MKLNRSNYCTFVHKIVTAHRVRFESPITYRAAARMPSLDELEDGDCGGAETPYENHSVIMEVRWVYQKANSCVQSVSQCLECLIY